MTPSARTMYRRWSRRRALAAASKKHGATDTTAWARADAVYSTEGKWQKTCARCAGPFESTRVDARFCGPACRKQASRTPIPTEDKSRDTRTL